MVIRDIGNDGDRGEGKGMRTRETVPTISATALEISMADDYGKGSTWKVENQA